MTGREGLRRRRSLAGAVVVALALAVLARPALAAFGDGATATSTFTTGVLQPPSELALSAGCTALTPNIRATWTATPSAAWADGYVLQHATSASGPWTATPVAGGATTAHTIEGLSPATTYHVRLQAVAGGWTSAWTATASTTTKAVNLVLGVCV